ncbi:MAG: tetratricopeptide repeat protein [Candidatus Omnitrophica bacterium]|nr:tetratricopeptide repeat protein [Candidatus Omnitrophota bacterium]
MSNQKTFLSGNLLFIVIIAAFIFLAFSPCLKAQYLNWDDHSHFYKHKPVQQLSWANVQTIFTETVQDIYIPLTTLSFSLEKFCFGFTPAVTHGINILFHAGVVLLALALALQLGISRRAAFLAALLFAIHPMHVESVAWATERKDVLYSMFYLGAVLAMTRRRYILAIFWTLLSLLAKPMALSLPCVMLWVAWYQGKFSLKSVFQSIPFFVLAIGIGWLTYMHHVRNPIASLGLSALTWLWTLGFYIWKFLWPWSLHPLYDLPQPVSLFYGPYFLTIIFLIATGLALYVRRGERLLRFALGWYFLSIFFLLRFDAKDVHGVADRFMYLPSLGLCFWFGNLFHEQLQRIHIKRWVLLGLVVLFLLLGVKTFLQCRIWRNNETLWTYVIKNYPRKELAYNDRAVAYADEGRFELAVKDLTTVLGFASNKALAFYNRGVTYRDWAERSLKNGQKKEAEALYGLSLKDFSDAIFWDKNYARTYSQRASVYFSLGEFDKAVRDTSSAIEREPSYPEAYHYRGNALAALKDFDKALSDHNRSIELNPSEPRYYNDRAIVLFRLGHKAEALSDLDHAILLDPGFKDAYFNRSAIQAH